MVRKQASLTPAVRHQESENDQGLAEAERCARRSSLMQQTKQLAACLRLSGNALLRRRSAKAQRTQPAPTEEKKYAPGAIRMIEIKRFMVYDHNVLRPGPKLNLLMGPNGTGKSTWVCAICLAFGQSTSLLGRSNHPEQFIKRGCGQAEISIELQQNSGRTLTIRREIKHGQPGSNSRSTSEYFINGSKVNLEHVHARASKYNVQLDNLCQFLPQEKVNEFASMDGKKVLIETEKALHNSELCTDHEQLIKEKKEIDELQSSIEKAQQRYEQEQKHVEARWKECEQVERQEQLKREYKMLEAKIAWVQYWSKDSEYKSKLEKLKEKKEEKNAADQELNRVRNPHKNIDNELNKMRNQRKEANKTLMHHDDRRANHHHSIKSKEDEMTFYNEQIKNLRGETHRRQQRVEKLQSDLEEKQEELNNMPLDPTDHEALSRLKTERNDLDARIRQKDNQIGDKSREVQTLRNKLEHKQSRIDHLKNVTEQAVKKLKEERPNVKLDAFISWLESNRQLLNSAVYGPIVKEIELADSRYASIVEKQVRPEDLLSFVTADSRDAKLLRRKAEDFKVTINEVSLNRSAPSPKFLLQDLQEYGIYATLDQAFKAPREVKDYLVKMKLFNKCYIGNRNTEKKIDELLNNREIIVFTSESQYSKNSTQYDKNFAYTEHNPLQQARFLGSTARPQDIQNEETEKTGIQKDFERVQQEYNTIHSEKKELEKRRETVGQKSQKKLKESKDYREKLSRLKNEITQNQTRLESEREQMGEQKQIDEYERKKARQRHDLSEEIIKAAKEHMSVLKQQSEVNCAKLVETQLVAQSMQLKDELKEYESRQSTLEQELRAAEQTATKVRGDREELHKKAAEEATLTDELREEFKKWPDEQSELESKKEEKEVERDGITIANPNALQEYKARKARIDELGEKLDSERSNLQQKQDSLKQVKQRWLPALRSLVQRLDKCFSDNFRKIGCRGGIELIEDEENFDKFRIDIKVAFRDSEGLHPLDGRRQSGGERSVSTMLYIIALQNLTKSPFRVVDEINQGMDVENEKHVYQCMVEAATRNETPQCFVLTPRLLPRLKFTDDVTVSLLFSGTEMKDTARQMREAVHHKQAEHYWMKRMQLA